ncbi:tRNA synthetases class I (M)-domain-containing protein [Cercophora samala]|uniref:methionine--tRNA ligase n=1 Tax=Cercophora samala TaxID=330535 RepID=A0AA39ZE48_9PEZI|nr:tRNA synthetases class I (M)-domain-containing protein [Cercophora samala]
MEETAKPEKVLPLPRPGERNILVTSALPYVNNVPHLGNIIGSALSADVFARFWRGRGGNVLFVGGTDEFGTTTSLRAREEGVTPQELCDKYYKIHKEVYEWFNISFDIFGRTNNSVHIPLAHDIFRELWGKGVINSWDTEQLWCEKCEGFVFDRLVEGTCPECGYEKARGDQCADCDWVLDGTQLLDPRCKIHGEKPVTRQSRHLFLDLDNHGPCVERMVEEKGGDWLVNAMNMNGNATMGITREGLNWGTPVPEWLAEFEGKSFYPWWDALLGYISITASGMGDWTAWWRPSKHLVNRNDDDDDDDTRSSCKSDNTATKPDVDVQLYQFLGPDNIFFHGVLFPATLLPLDPPYTAPHHIASTRYLTYRGGKFSKSLGVGVFGDNAQETGLSADVFRFYLLESRPENLQNTEFTWDRLIKVNNELLVGKIGYLIRRVLVEVNGVVPHRCRHTSGPTLSSVEQMIAGFKKGAHRLLRQYVNELEEAKLRGGLMTTLELARGGIALLDLASNKVMSTNRSERQAVLELEINLVYLLARMLEPYIPDTVKSLYKVLRVGRPVGRFEEDWFVRDQGPIEPGHEVGKWEEVEGLFERIMPEKAKMWELQFGGRKKRDGEVLMSGEAKRQKD